MNPKLSIIVTGRNDDYGGDFNQRLQNSINWWSFFLQKHKIHAEYLFVNWNPISEKPSLKDIIKWNSNAYFNVKILEVPNSVHTLFDVPEIRKNNDLYEFIAKNSGIRRATGEYILSTNADILCDPAIFQFIALNKLEKNCFYRSDRYDYRQRGIIDLSSPELQLREIRKNVFFAHCFGKSFNFPKRYNFNISIAICKFKSSIFRRWNLYKAANPYFFNTLKLEVNLKNAEFQIHTNASGDFMLMHRDLR